MDRLLQELKKFVSSWGWTYAVVWKIGPDHRTPVWHQSYFNEFEESESGQAEQFENIFKSCQFTPVRPGYSYLAWHQQSPYWWTKELEELTVPTDENKELFLTTDLVGDFVVCMRPVENAIQQAKIQTLVCFPGRAPADGTGYCVELASTSVVPESEYFKASIRDFISTSIAPHISSTPLLPEVPSLQAITSSASMSAAQTMAAVALQQDAAILTDISSQAVLHGEDDASFGGNIAREEEHYFPWTMQTSHYVNVSNYPLANLGDYNYFDINPPSYGTGDPFQTTEWPPSSAGTSARTSAQGSRKGKEALVEAEPGSTQSLTLPLSSQNLGSLQQEYYLEKLSKPPSLGPQESSQIVMPPSGIASASGSSAGLRPIGGHSPTSRFQPYRQYPQFPRLSPSKKQSFIYKWATVLAPQIMRMRGGLQGLGSGGSERLSLSDSLATHAFDPRSPTSLAHDHLAAETHKIAERKRRYKMNNKLRTLISIIPIIDKKDKVSVLTSTIEYIRQLSSRISSLEDREGGAGAAATTSRMEEEAATMSVDREEELALFSNVDSAGAGPSSSSSSGGPVVLLEGSPDSETWLVKVQARNYSRSLIQLLNVFQELGLEVITVDYGTMNDRFRANVCIKNSKNLSSVSSSDLKETLCRVLEIVESPTTGLR